MFACVLALLLPGARAFAAQDAALSVAPRIVDRVDESRLVPIKGTVHPLANARNDRGAAPASMQLERMHLVLKRSDSQEASLRQLISDMHTPGAASYHKWLTPDQFGKQFGPSDQDITTVETWLTGHGFSVTKVNPGRQTIEFSGNVSQLRSAFHTQIHAYAVNGETHYANAADPEIPAALAPVVGGFVSLNNFHVRSYAKPLGHASYDPKTDKATPQWTVGTDNFVLAPVDYALQYDLSPLYGEGTNGAGQTIAIINESNINVGLVNQFRSLFGLPANPPQIVIDGNDPGVDGINNPDGPNGASVEAYLDVEWAGAVAPGATVDLVIGGDTALEGGLFLAAEHAVYNNLAPIMSLSFGACEANIGTTNSFLNSLWEQAAAQGITVLVSTGDSGSAGCDNDNVQEYAVSGQAVNGFASTPYNVAVGGTDFYYGALNAIQGNLSTYWNTTATPGSPAVSIKTVIPEQPWNDSQFGITLQALAGGSSPTSTSIAAGSGGASSIYTKPAWQKGSGVPGDSKRDIPDVSLFASNGANGSYYPLCAVDADCQPASSGGAVQISGVGGTSASTPAFAGIMAMVNQKYGRQGQANFVLYPLAAQFPAAFHDVKNGTNSVPCNIDATSLGQPASPDCIAVTSPVTIDDPNFGTATEGQIGTGTTAEYNAVAGYDLASGLGTVDASVLVNDWNKVTFASTTTTLTPSKTSFAHGTAITVSGNVTATTGTPTGDVALMTANTDPGQQGQAAFALTSGAYTASVNYLPGGTYNIWGQYSGDPNNGPSSSTPVQVTVTPESSTLSLNIFSPLGTFTASSTPGSSVDYGTQLALNAQPSSTSNTTLPTGTVTFTDGSTTLNTAVINAEGDAEYNAPFAVGAHSVAAKYSGDNSYNASTAAPIAFTVVKDSPALSLYASIQDQSGDVLNGTGQPTVFTIVIANNAQFSAGSNGVFPVPVAPPTGIVTVTGLPSGVPTTATLVPGVDPVFHGGTGAVVGIANFVVPAGTSSTSYTAKVSYAGDANYNAIPQSASTTFTIPVLGLSSTGLQASTTTATMSGNISPTSTIVVNGTVTGSSGHAAPTGFIVVYDSGYYVGQAGLTAGSGDVANFSTTLTSQILSQGANLITIQYFGDPTYAPSAFNLNSGNPISNPLSDFTLIPQSAIVAVDAPGDNATIPVNITSTNGFAGAVNLSVGPATTLGVKAQIPPSATLTANGTQSVNLQVTPAVALGSGTFNVELIGTDSTGKYVHTTGVQVAVGGNVAATPGFMLTNNGNISVPAGNTTGNTATITVTPLNGFTGAVNLGCAITGPSGATDPATCTVTSAVTISGATAQPATLTITTGTDTTVGTYTATVTGTAAGGVTGTTTVTVNVTAPASFTLSNSGGITVAAGATSGNTSTITVIPANGFTGTVSMTCAITAAPTGGVGSPTCSLSPALATTTSTLTVGTGSTTTPGTYTVTVTGTAGTETQTTTVTLTVTSAVAPGFTLSNSGGITVSAPGATGNTSTITINPSGGFSGTVSLICAITASPTGAIDTPGCSLSPTSATTTSVLSVTTTAATSALAKPKNLFWPTAGGAVLALVVFFGIPARRRNWSAMLGLVVLLGLFVSIGAIGCGGSGNKGGGGGGGNAGTTVGTYTVTVTGTSGTITQTTTVTLTVQ